MDHRTTTWMIKCEKIALSAIGGRVRICTHKATRTTSGRFVEGRIDDCKLGSPRQRGGSIIMQFKVLVSGSWYTLEKITLI